MIKTPRDRVRLFPGEVGSRKRCRHGIHVHRSGERTHSGAVRTARVGVEGLDQVARGSAMSVMAAPPRAEAQTCTVGVL